MYSRLSLHLGARRLLSLQQTRQAPHHILFVFPIWELLLILGIEELHSLSRELIQ